MRYHHLTLIHGHEYRGGIATPVNPARSFVLKARACIVGGHHHRTSDHTDNTIQDTLISGWSLGCACDLHPEYAPLNNWNHGFAVLDTHRNWRIENHKVQGGDVL